MKPRLAFVMILFFFVMCSDRLLAQPYITQSDVPAERGFRAVALLGGLEHPWSMVWLPNGDILVTERPGRLRRVRDGRLASGSIAGVPEVFDSGQGGLLDISLHPRFEQNRRVYFTYAYGSTIANRTRVATAVLNSDRLKKWQVIFEVAANKFGGQHFGSRLLWLPDETLLVSIGDGGNPPVRLEGDWIRKQAQNRRSHLGKILRFKDNGSVPPDNPFVNSADLQTTIWSYG
ncbi:MAG: PQQ-dependent sugar dehydrogenase, partial [Desulfobacterales bacterium]